MCFKLIGEPNILYISFALCVCVYIYFLCDIYTPFVLTKKKKILIFGNFFLENILVFLVWMSL